MANTDNYAMGWDDAVSNDEAGFITLPEGEYDFTVKSFERGSFPGSAKMAPSPKASLQLQIEAPEGTAVVFTDLILNSMLEWKISSFFRSVGLKKKGEPFKPQWDKLVGLTGRAYIKTRTYITKDGNERTANEVDRYIDKPAVATKPKLNNPDNAVAADASGLLD
jgi:hypothetical protein